MKVLCPRCGTRIPGVDIDLQADRAECRPCHRVVPLPRTPTALAPLEATLLAKKAYRPNDLRWTEAHGADGWRFQLPPNRRDALRTIVAYGGFIAISLVALLSRGVVWEPLLLGLLAGLASLLTGFFGGYLNLVGGIDRPRMALDTSEFSLRQAPLPLAKPIREALPNIVRFESALRDRKWKTGNRGPTLHTVRYLTGDGRAVALPLSLPGAEHAEFVASRLNAALEEQRYPRGYRG